MKARIVVIVLIFLPIAYFFGADYMLGGALRNTVSKSVGFVKDDPTPSPTPTLAPIKQIPCDTTTNKVYNYELAMSDGAWQLRQLDDQAGPNTTTIADRQSDIPGVSSASGNGDSQANGSYQVSTDGPSLVINSAHPDQVCSFTANVAGVDTYYSMHDSITTDIPSQVTAADFRDYEQEDFLPIFGYHFIIPDNEPKPTPLEITLSKFIEQVEYATNVMGCRWFTFGDIMQNYVLQGKKTPRRACVMTFDDGRRSNYDLAYPVLTQYGIKASFYIILGRVGRGANYMTWSQIDELSRAGHEIGSHTISHDGAIVPGRNYAQVVSEVWTSKQMLEDRGFHVVSFAYPLGLWDATTVLVLKNSQYSGARDSEKPDLWRDPRPLTTSMDPDFIWHMYYHRPDHHVEKKPDGNPITYDRPETETEIKIALGYTSWWQFEEGYSVTNGKPVIRQLYAPSPETHGVVELNNGASITNSFIVSKSDHFIIDIFGATESNNNNAFAPYGSPGDFSIYVDGMLQTYKRLADGPCIQSLRAYFCDFLVDVPLAEGKHTITVASNGGGILLDKFRIFRNLPLHNTYQIQITESVPGNAPSAK